MESYLYPKGAKRIQTTWDILRDPRVLTFCELELFQNNYTHLSIVLCTTSFAQLLGKCSSLLNSCLFIGSCIPTGKEHLNKIVR
jgi:hypothetical protein